MTVSHELRTPLNAIYGWARLLGTGRVNDEQRRTDPASDVAPELARGARCR